MSNSAQRSANTIVFVGIIVIAVTVLSYYRMSSVAFRDPVSTFSIVYVVLQEFLLFACLTVQAFCINKSVPVAVGAAYVSGTLIYNSIAILTTAFFHFVLIPQHANLNDFVTVALAETGLWLALMVGLRLVTIAHTGSHSKAEQIHDYVDSMVASCDRLYAHFKILGWRTSPTMRELAESIRYSEGIRQDQSLIGEIQDRLSRLEALVGASQDQGGQVAADCLIREISILALRRR